jgi:hypothetical protein
MLFIPPFTRSIWASMRSVCPVAWDTMLLAPRARSEAAWAMRATASLAWVMRSVSMRARAESLDSSSVEFCSVSTSRASVSVASFTCARDVFRVREVEPIFILRKNSRCRARSVERRGRATATVLTLSVAMLSSRSASASPTARVNSISAWLTLTAL